VDISARPADQPAKRSKADLDPEIAELVPQFLQEMLQKSASISQAAENGDFQAAMDQAHQVIGPGGSFGFPEISNMGRVLEGAAGRKDQAELKRLAQEFNLYMNQVKVIYE
jgi:hypothetical protein